MAAWEKTLYLPNLRQLGAAALVASLVFTFSALGAFAEQSGDPGKPVALKGDQAGMLQGKGAGGSFVYYSFPYAGDNSTATINLNASSNDLAGSEADLIGFNAYGPNGDLYAWSGQQPGMSPNLVGNLISMDKGTYIVQIYNYSDRPMDFTLGITGLPSVAAPAPMMVAAPPMAAPAAAPPAMAAPAASMAPIRLDTPVTGTLGRGSFTYHTFTYPGAYATYTLNANVTPDDPSVLTEGLVGFNVYGPTGELNAIDGVQTGMSPNLSGDLNNPTAGTYTIQLFNLSSRDVGYTFWISPGK